MEPCRTLLTSTSIRNNRPIIVSVYRVIRRRWKLSFLCMKWIRLKCSDMPDAEIKKRTLKNFCKAELMLSYMKGYEQFFRSAALTSPWMEKRSQRLSALSLRNWINATVITFTSWTGRCTWEKALRTFMNAMFLMRMMVTATSSPNRKKHWKLSVFLCRIRTRSPARTTTEK